MVLTSDVLFFLKDGRIDYNEFATMMRKGDGGAGNRTMRGNLNFNLAEALGATDTTGVDDAIGNLKVSDAENPDNDSSKAVDESSDKVKDEDGGAGS